MKNKYIKNLIYMASKIEGLNLTKEEVFNILDGINVPNIKLDEINTILNLRDA